MNALFYVLRGGCPWRMLPEHFPPHQTAYRWFVRFRDSGLWESLNHRFLMLGPRGFDAAKKVKGGKRHVLVDSDGRALSMQVHPADIQDRDGARPLLRASRRSFPFVERLFADSAYAGKRVAGDRAKVERSCRVRGSAKTMDRRAVLGLD